MPQRHDRAHSASWHTVRTSLLAVSAIVASAIVPAAASAQAQRAPTGPVVQQPVVQQLPSAGRGDLSSALRRLARNPRDLDALVDAGNGALGVGDVAAAIGFFGRAQQLAPADPRVTLGLAGAYVRAGRPVEALRLYDEAHRSGAATSAAGAKDRGLAYDLVGDNARAQAAYRTALGTTDDEAARRMAISQAIAGDKTGFESTLLPLLQRQDLTAFRTRAFGLAILGEEREAVRIAEAMLPRETAGRVTPYLRFMPRLTRAQQAAAANLGIFPRAAQIGRDDPALAAYAPPATAQAPRVAAARPAQGEAGARLAPAGEPLGSRAVAASQAARQARAQTQAQTQAPTGAVAAAPRSPAPTTSARAGTAISTNLQERQAAARAEREQRARTAAAANARPLARPDPAPVQAIPALAAQAAPSAPAIAREPAPARIVLDPARSAPVTIAQPASPAPAPSPAIILPPPAAPPATPVVAAAPASAAAPAAQAAEPSVSQAFAEFALQPPPRPAPQAAGGIDITTITPPRERPAAAAPPASQPARAAAAQAPAPVQRAAATPTPAARAAAAARPAAPAHPSRIWVQVATGRDRAALRFDWRRIARQAGDVLQGKRGHLAAWGDRTRLLAGPFDSARAAREAITALKAKELDGLPFTSSAGEEVAPIQ